MVTRVHLLSIVVAVLVFGAIISGLDCSHHAYSTVASLFPERIVVNARSFTLSEGVGILKTSIDFLLAS